MLKYLQLGFLPTSSDLGVLVLRLTLAAQMLTAHGWRKLTAFPDKAVKFPDS